MKKILNQLFDHQRLSEDQAKEVLTNISHDKYNPSQVAAFISVYLMRGISINELNGFRSALLELCVPLDLENVQSIDVCGTGGDGKNTFNISTLTAFVLAGAGYKVTKHGNYGVSSVCGSSNVLQHLGCDFSNNETKLKTQLDRTNICFLHAPLFHPALKSVAAVRKELGVKTFFNFLGPLVNPCQPSHQLVGVFNLKIQQLYKYTFENLTTNFSIIHALDGYDEVSLTGETSIVTNYGSLLEGPIYFDSPKLKASQIHGGNTIKEAASIFIKVLRDEGSAAQKQVVLANTALAIKTIKPQASILDCKSEAQTSIESGAALEALNKLIELS